MAQEKIEGKQLNIPDVANEIVNDATAKASLASQYLNRNGGSPSGMLVDLDMGSNAIVNVGNVDGVDVSVLRTDYDSHLGSPVASNTHKQIDAHIADSTLHFTINDTGSPVSLTTVYSSSKVSSDLLLKQDKRNWLVANKGVDFAEWGSPPWATGSPSTPKAPATDSIALGNGAICNERDGVAIGTHALTGIVPGGDNFGWNVAIGAYSKAAGSYNIAIGTDAITQNFPSDGSPGTVFGAISIGNAAKAQTSNTIAIGQGNSIKGLHSIGMGANTNMLADYGIGIGYNTQTFAANNIAIGKQAQAGSGSPWVNNTNAISIGTSAAAYETGTLALGNVAAAQGSYAISIGDSSQAVGLNTIAIGHSAFVNSVNYAVAIGYGLTNTTPNSVMIGHGTHGSPISVFHMLMSDNGVLTLTGAKAQFVQPNYSGSPVNLPIGVTGGTVYDTTVSRVKAYNGSSWVAQAPEDSPVFTGIPQAPSYTLGTLPTVVDGGFIYVIDATGFGSPAPTGSMCFGRTSGSPAVWVDMTTGKAVV